MIAGDDSGCSVGGAGRVTPILVRRGWVICYPLLKRVGSRQVLAALGGEVGGPPAERVSGVRVGSRRR